MQSLIEAFVTLWVVIDPIGTVPVFIAVTAGMATAARKKTALQAALVSAGVLMFFLVFGQILINALGIGLNSFQVAGGIILFLFALTMIFGESKPESDLHAAEAVLEQKKKANVAVYPLAVPSLASPGAMLSIVLLTDNNRFSIADQSVTAVVMLLVIAIAYLFMRLAEPIIRLIGEAGSAIVSRVMGMILASVAANAVLSGILTIVQTGEL
ncbi:MarC family protein [Pseudoruegeria sp. SHC-113]|uniref:MarC family protein n=1 Tax=Pseudoruegeria sp. SHC-113 TaxID=2855439 RepID=UPI0021BB4671|nr:MarC family protein [Pseudoruegeria sp. SHC-113]MCT8160509.1 MarC family protein [Pseudoruegeria sp. SHC-113]